MVFSAILASKISILKSLQACHRPTIRVIFRTLKKDHRPANSIKFSVKGVEKADPSISWDSWFTSFAGRQFMAKYVGFGGLLGVITGFWCFKIVFMEWIRDEYKEEGPQISMRARISGVDEEVAGRSPKLLLLVSDCQDRAGMEDASVEHLDVFYSSLMDPVVAGCTKTRQGGLVGLPRYMVEENFDWRHLRVKTNFNRTFEGFKIPEAISQEEEQELKKYLTFSEQEKQFLMSLSLAKVSSRFAIVSMAVPCVFWVFHYTMAYKVNNKLRLLEGNKLIRLAVQGMLACISICLYICYINMSNLKADTDAMKHICTTLEEVKVALVYFEKILDRNKVLRKLVGEGMEHYVQETGELVPFFYEIDVCASLQARIEFLKDLLEEMNDREEEINDRKEEMNNRKEEINDRKEEMNDRKEELMLKY